MWAATWGGGVAANVLLGVSQGRTWSSTVVMKIDRHIERGGGGPGRHAWTDGVSGPRVSRSPPPRRATAPGIASFATVAADHPPCRRPQSGVCGRRGATAGPRADDLAHQCHFAHSA